MLAETQTGQPFLSLVHDAGAERTPEDLRERERWLSGQREAFEAALSDAPLTTSLGILADAVTDRFGPGVRAAFYLADDEGKTLHHIVGMSDDYAKAVDGFEIGPESWPAAWLPIWAKPS